MKEKQFILNDLSNENSLSLMYASLLSHCSCAALRSKLQTSQANLNQAMSFIIDESAQRGYINSSPADKNTCKKLFSDEISNQ